MDAFEQIVTLPALRQLFDLAWRTFGVNPALVAPDGGRLVIYDREARSQPFCGALQHIRGGSELCSMCDQGKFLEARRGGQSLRYRCHAGLIEFIIPVLRNGQVIALIQCGQVHETEPSEEAWQVARRSLLSAGIREPALRKLFRKNRVLNEVRQNDVLDLLGLIAARLGSAGEAELRASPAGRTQVGLGRAMTYIEAHLGEPLRIEAIALSSALSTRTLMRLFRKEAGVSVVEYIQQRRIARARTLLQTGAHTCAEVAFECGFGSVQHFNRVFRRKEKCSPTEWATLHPHQERGLETQKNLPRP